MRRSFVALISTVLVLLLAAGVTVVVTLLVDALPALGLWILGMIVAGLIFGGFYIVGKG